MLIKQYGEHNNPLYATFFNQQKLLLYLLNYLKHFLHKCNFLNINQFHIFMTFTVTYARIHTSDPIIIVIAVVIAINNELNEWQCSRTKPLQKDLKLFL